MKGGARVVEILAALRRLGVRLTIDDFGTGYSRLGHLRHYPIDKLKIDQSFLCAMRSNPDDASVVATIIAMAKGLKLKVIAEGVETEEQFAYLREHKCDEMQGFLFSRPVPAEQFEELLKSKTSHSVS
jgi:EAL domain-containing protein (putative c-di-GMP-specific phosphodiesterase class I)